jgi:hypothetical protein
MTDTERVEGAESHDPETEKEKRDLGPLPAVDLSVKHPLQVCDFFPACFHGEILPHRVS